MKSAIEKIYFVFIICAVSGVFNRLFGGATPLDVGRSASLTTGGDSNRTLLILNLLVLCSTLLLAFSKLPSLLRMLTRMRLLLVLHIFALASTVWSVERLISFRSGVYLFMYLVAAAYIATRFEYEELVWMLGKTLTLLALASIPGQYLLPSVPTSSGQWTGVFQHKDGLGLAMVIGIVSLVLARKPWTLIRMSSIALCFALLCLSRSLGPFLWLVTAVASLAFLRSRGRARPIMLIALLGPIVILPIAVPNFLAVVTGMLGKDPTLTGRTEVWAIVIRMILVHPLLGYGAGAFWSTEAQMVHVLVGNWSPHHAHNGYLDICLNLGIVGLALVLIILVDIFRRTRDPQSEASHDAGEWLFTVAMVIMVLAVSEVTFLQVSISWFVLLLAYISHWRAVEMSAAEPDPDFWIAYDGLDSACLVSETTEAM